MKRTSRANYKTLTCPLPDGKCFVVGFFGDAAEPDGKNGWSVIDISVENPDGSSKTLCSALYQQNHKQSAAPGAISVMIFDNERAWPNVDSTERKEL